MKHHEKKKKKTETPTDTETHAPSLPDSYFAAATLQYNKQQATHNSYCKNRTARYFHNQTEAASQHINEIKEKKREVSQFCTTHPVSTRTSMLLSKKKRRKT